MSYSKFQSNFFIQVSESWEVRPTFGEVVVALSAAAVTHYRRRAVAAESRGNDARAAAISKDNARF